MPQVTDPDILAQFSQSGSSVKPPPQRVYGRAKSPAPVREEVQRGEELSNLLKALTAEQKRRDLDAGDLGKAAAEERKNAGFFRAMIQGNDNFSRQSSEAQVPSYGGKIARGTAGDLANVVGINTPEQQKILQAKKGFIRGVLRMESGAVIGDTEFKNADEEFFPQPGDKKDVIEQKRLARVSAIQGMRAAAGILSDEVVDDINVMRDAEKARAEADEKVRDPDLVGGVQRGSEIEFGPQDEKPFNRGEYLESAFGITPQNEQAIMGFYNANLGNKGFSAENVSQFYSAMGIPSPSSADVERMVEQVRSGEGPFGQIDTSAAEEDRRAELEEMADTAEQRDGAAGFEDRITSGFTLGLNDEIVGLATAAGEAFGDKSIAENYRDGRDMQRLINERAENKTGLAGDVVEIGSSLILPGGSIRKVKDAAKMGAAFGTVGGFGYGEGTAESAVGALSGSLIGGGAGAAGQRFGNALLARAQRKKAASERASALSGIGSAEGVQVNKAMTDPRLTNRVTGVEATMTGGPVIRREMDKVADDIERSVKNLGAPGVAKNNETGGDLILSASERFIDKTGRSAKAKYDRAEQLAGSTSVQPDQSLKTVDEAISKLSETENLNSAEIAFLQKMKQDFSKDLSVGALRRVRTSLRKKINKGDLVFGEDEATVLSVMDAAAEDIASGLSKAGKQDAAKAFVAADKSYRARMDYITDTIQKLVGKRGSNLSSEQVFRKFQAMATPGGNAKGLRKFYATLTPDEAMDVSATFAERLGLNNKGEFSTAHLLSQVEKMPEGARKTIFGPKGFESLNNLTKLAKEHARVMGGLNHSRTGVANDYRSWLANIFVPGALGFALDGLMTGGASAAVALGTKAAKDNISARLLMSPKVTKWALNAPKTSSPKAIDNHFAKLGNIAKAEPALSAEINLLQDIIIKVANDNSQKAVAQDKQ